MTGYPPFSQSLNNQMRPRSYEILYKNMWAKNILYLYEPIDMKFPQMSDS